MSRDNKLTENPLRQMPAAVEVESTTAQSTRQQARGELADAIAITEAIISKHQQTAGQIDSKAIYAEVTGLFEMESAERTTEAVADLTDRFHYLINGGRSALETELGYIDKAQITEDKKKFERDQLQRQYAEAKVMEKMAIVRVAELLLHKFLNPYESLDNLVKLTNSTQNEAGQWSSEFDPNTLAPGTRPLISAQSVQEMRAGIQLALTMRQGVTELTKRHRGYDGRPDAKAIIQAVFGIKINGRARVVAEGPLSISIVVTDEADYYAIHGGNDPERRSGGFHNHYLKTWLTEPRTYGKQYTALPSAQQGLINFINGYERADTIDHENEHSLFEILIKNRGKKPDPIQTLVDKARKNPQQPLGKSIDGTMTELLFEANDRFISGFANEVLAYVLNNESTSTPTNYIVDSVFRRLTESKLYSHHHLTAEVIEKLKKDLLARSEAARQAGSMDDRTATILQDYDHKVAADITKENLSRQLKDIITAVAELAKKYPNNKNYIRAILAGTNPLHWSKIGYQIGQGYWKHDTQPRGVNDIQNQEQWRLRHQLDTVRILIQTLEGNPPSDDQTPEQLSGDVFYQLKPGEQLETTVQVGERTLFWIQNKSQRQLMDSNGQKIFEGNYDQSRTPTPLTVDGKIVCSVELVVEESHGRYDARTKKVILKEGVQKPIGLEYGAIGEVGQWQGKIIFPAKLATGFWCIVDEDGKMLSEQFDDKPSITYGKDHYYVEGEQNNKYITMNDLGVPIGPQQPTDRQQSICVNASDGKVYIVSDYRLYAEGGEEIVLPLEQRTSIELIAGSHGLIVRAQRYKANKIIFLQSGKEITAESIAVEDQCEKKFFILHEDFDHDRKYYFVDDQGNTIGTDFPQPLLSVHISSEDQYIYEVGKWKQLSLHRPDGTQLVAVGNNTMIHAPDWKVAAFCQTDDSGQSTIIDLTGKKLFTVAGLEGFDYHHDQGESYFIAKTADKKYTVLDSTGKYLITDCNEVAAITNGQIYYRQGDQIKILRLAA